jgi:hypothetical protein
LFVGLYKVGTPQLISYNEFWNKQVNQVNKDLQNLGMTARLPGLWFDLKLTDICIEMHKFERQADRNLAANGQGVGTMGRSE